MKVIQVQQQLDNEMPSTKLLRELGFPLLVRAIRKKHGGFVTVAKKFGYKVNEVNFEIQKKITSRLNRRKKRQIRVEKHDFY